MFETRADTDAVIASEAARLPWARPSYARVQAGEAELGPNPDTVDGVFTNS